MKRMPLAPVFLCTRWTLDEGQFTPSTLGTGSTEAAPVIATQIYAPPTSAQPCFPSCLRAIQHEGFNVSPLRDLQRAEVS